MNRFPFYLLFLKMDAYLMWNLDPVYISEHETSPMIKFEEIKNYFNTLILNTLKNFHLCKNILYNLHTVVTKLFY